MKKTILSAAIMLAASSMYAQITIAPEVGLNIAKVSGKDELGNSIPDIKSKTGLKLGAVVNFPISHGFFIQTGAFYSAKGFKLSDKETYMGQTAEYNSRLNENGVEIPLNAGYQYSFGKAGGVFVTAGPYLSYLFSAKTSQKYIENGMVVDKEETDLNIGSSDNDDIKALDFGVNFSAGYRSPFGVYARVQYGLGLANIISGTDNGEAKNRVLGVSVGYNIKIGK